MKPAISGLTAAIAMGGVGLFCLGSGGKEGIGGDSLSGCLLDEALLLSPGFDHKLVRASSSCLGDL